MLHYHYSLPAGCCFLLVAFASIAFSPAQGQPSVKVYEHLGGSKNISSSLNESGDGYYIYAFDFNRRDTVWIWIEHLTYSDSPSYRSAKWADVVVWCFAQKNPHKNHVFPNSSGYIYIRTKKDKIYIAKNKKLLK